MRDYLAQLAQGGDIPHPSTIERRINMRIWFENFLRDNGIKMVICMLLTAWTLLTCGITGAIVRRNTTIEVTARVQSEMRAGFQKYLDQQEEDRRAAQFLSGEASKQAAIKEDAKYLACIGQGVLNTYQGADLEDARKVMICAVCRVLSGGEFAGITSIKAAVTAKDQWWGYKDGMSYTEDVYTVALDVASTFENGGPMPCSTDMVYAVWNGFEIVLRNRWEDNSSAKHY